MKIVQLERAIELHRKSEDLRKTIENFGPDTKVEIDITRFVPYPHRDEAMTEAVRIAIVQELQLRRAAILTELKNLGVEDAADEA